MDRDKILIKQREDKYTRLESFLSNKTPNKGCFFASCTGILLTVVFNENF